MKSKVKVDTKRITACSFAADESHLYLHNQLQGLVKFGNIGGSGSMSELGGAQINYIVSQKQKYCNKVIGSCLAVTTKKLFLYSTEISSIFSLFYFFNYFHFKHFFLLSIFFNFLCKISSHFIYLIID
jgi:hypothetical protein